MRARSHKKLISLGMKTHRAESLSSSVQFLPPCAASLLSPLRGCSVLLHERLWEKHNARLLHPGEQGYFKGNSGCFEDMGESPRFEALTSGWGSFWRPCMDWRRESLGGRLWPVLCGGGGQTRCCSLANLPAHMRPQCLGDHRQGTASWGLPREAEASTAPCTSKHGCQQELLATQALCAAVGIPSGQPCSPKAPYVPCKGFSSTAESYFLRNESWTRSSSKLLAGPKRGRATCSTFLPCRNMCF